MIAKVHRKDMVAAQGTYKVACAVAAGSHCMGPYRVVAYRGIDHIFAAGGKVRFHMANRGHMAEDMDTVVE